MLSGKAAAQRPEVDELRVRPVPLQPVGQLPFRRSPVGKRGGLRSLVNAMTEQQRRAAGLRRNGQPRRRVNRGT